MAGRDGSIGCVGTTARSWDEAKEKVLKRAKAIDIPSKAYRVDVVPDAEERWDALADHGYLTHADVPGRPPAPAMPRSRSAAVAA